MPDSRPQSDVEATGPRRDDIAEGRSPRWQLWAMLLVALGCLATIAATYYDIA